MLSDIKLSWLELKNPKAAVPYRGIQIPRCDFEGRELEICFPPNAYTSCLARGVRFQKIEGTTRGLFRCKVIGGKEIQSISAASSSYTIDENDLDNPFIVYYLPPGANLSKADEPIHGTSVKAVKEITGNHQVQILAGDRLKASQDLYGKELHILCDFPNPVCGTEEPADNLSAFLLSEVGGKKTLHELPVCQIDVARSSSTRLVLIDWEEPKQTPLNAQNVAT